MKGLVCILALFLSINSAFAQYTLTDDDVEVENGILKNYTGEEKDIIIPKELDGQLVTGIGVDAFLGNGLTSVVIGNSVKSIGKDAFSWNELTSIVIPNSVKSIGLSAFQGNNLTSIEIPNSVTSIGDWAFHYNNLTSIEIPNSVKSIGLSAFQGNNLTSVVIPSSVTSIGVRAFNENQIEKINGKPSDALIYARKKNGKEDKTKIVSYGGAKKVLDFIPNSVKSIGAWAFYQNNLTSVEIPNSVKSIGNWAFYKNNLTSVKLEKGSSLIEIGKKAFGKNSALEIKIPKDAKAEFVEYDGKKYKPGEVIKIESEQ